MGTRSDYYVGTGPEAVWLGSLAWDGYPDGVEPSVLNATTEDEYREALAGWFLAREDATLPAEGWPWPWDDSGITDYAYTFDGGSVKAAVNGVGWFDPKLPEPEVDDVGLLAQEFPDMSSRKNVVLFGSKSGLVVISGGSVED
jgi:hypothetical protein